MKRLILLLALAAAPAVVLCQKTCEIVAPGTGPILLADGFEFTEGPAADRRGNVYFTDQPNNRILVWTVSGELRVFLNEAGRSNGLYFDRDGRHLLAAADGGNELWRIAPDGSYTVLVTDFDGRKLNGPNDLWVNPVSGGIYFTDPLYARPYWTHRDRRMQQDGEHVYYVVPEGRNGSGNGAENGNASRNASGSPDENQDFRQVVRVAGDLEKPNGIIGTPDGKTLYVADIGANKTYAYDIAPDGKLSGKRLFAPMGSDGMTIDSEGNVYLTGRGVTVFDSEGTQIAHIDVPEDWTANVTFGGRDRKTLFITASDALYSIRTNIKGIK